MDDKEFANLAEKTIADIEARLERCSADIDFEIQPGGILEIEFANGSKIVINRQAALREIWVAARSGGFHFRHNGEIWRDTRSDDELIIKLSTLASDQAGELVVL
ncbi:MAG: iron donor protein CyaY [Betaproteobacteria bacterium]